MTTHDKKLVRTAQTMTAGVTASKLEIGATIDIHGYSAKVKHTDVHADVTLIQYDNLARRTFSTHHLNGYLELGTFPVGTTFERPTAPVERAVIAAVTGDCCYQVRITAGSTEPRHETFSYADFIAWHMDNAMKPVVQLETDPDLVATTNKLADAVEQESNPFEEELQKRVEELTDENFKLKQAIQQQVRTHATVIAGYEEDLQRLEAKAAILNPAPTLKEVCTLMQVLHIPEMRKSGDMELAAKLSDGWTVLHIDISTEFAVESDCHIRIVTLVRDLPAAPAPKVAEVGLHIGAIPLVRPPMPLPANQTIIHQPGSRALTNNVSRTTGETKRIPSLADIQARREKDTAEIDAIMQRGLDAQEVLRRQFAQSSSPFNRLGAQ